MPGGGELAVALVAVVGADQWMYQAKMLYHSEYCIFPVCFLFMKQKCLSHHQYREVGQVIAATLCVFSSTLLCLTTIHQPVDLQWIYTKAIQI